jgi:hypothetical protein
MNDPVTKVCAFVADEHPRPSDQLLDLVLALAAERAVERRGADSDHLSQALECLRQRTAQIVELVAERRLDPSKPIFAHAAPPAAADVKSFDALSGGLLRCFARIEHLEAE